MIKALKALFELPSSDTQESLEHRVQLAAAALLIETAGADFSHDGVEQTALEQRLSDSLNLDREEVHSLVEQARQRSREATSLYEFTEVINQQYQPAQKQALIASMWAVAYADEVLDKHEEHLIRQVADLIYVPHQEFIKTKLAAKPPQR